MRDQNSSENLEQHPGSHQTEETNEARKARIQKNRAIRKQKLGARIIVEQSVPIVNSLTKQAKFQLQKVKNREAAQRSREQRKQYIQTLEEQNKQLKKKLSQPRYCGKCNLLLNNNSTSIDTQITHFEEEKIMNLQDQKQEQIQFIRLQGNEDISPMNFFLFVTLIFACVLIPGIQSHNQVVFGDPMMFANARILAEINQPEMTQSQKFMEVKNGLVPANYQLTQFIPGTCLKRIIEDNSQRILVGDPAEYMQTQIAQPSNTFVCEKPKVYRRPQSANIFSKFIDIIVSGREVREIIKSEQGYQLRQVELDGLYSLKTQVRQIIKLDYLQNCLN